MAAGPFQFPDVSHNVPAADSTSNASVADVVGNKTDAAQATVGTTRSIIAYVKGLLNSVQQQATSSETGTDSTTTSGTYRQLIASTAAATKKIVVDGNIGLPDAENSYTIVLATGAAASEVILASSMKRVIAAGGTTFHFHSSREIASGTRIAWRPTFAGTNSLVALGYNVEER